MSTLNLRIAAGILVSVLIAIPAFAAEDQLIRLAPSVEIFRSALDFDDHHLNPGQELASGLTLGARLISASNLAKTFDISLDLRQSLAQVDGRRGLDLLATRLGVHGDWILSDGLSIGAAWYFGDTIVARHRDRQYNGSSAAFFLSLWGHESIRGFLQAAIGSHQEGPGFIFLSRRPGEEGLKWRSIGIGVEFPFPVNLPTFRREPGSQPEI